MHVDTRLRLNRYVRTIVLYTYLLVYVSVGFQISESETDQR